MGYEGYKTGRLSPRETNLTGVRLTNDNGKRKMERWVHVCLVMLTIFGMALILVTMSCGNPATQTMLTDSVNASVSKSGHGLCLTLSVDSTTYQSGQEITMFVDEQNSLSKVNHVLSSSKWPLNGLELGPSYPCGILSSYYPFGVAVFQGYYTSSNLSKAVPLNLNEPDVIMHGCILRIGHNFAYDFKPLSDIEILDYGTNNQDLNNIVLKDEIGLKGYWTNDSVSQFNNFDPGVYTVIAGDEWGALVILHFTVSNATAASTP